MCAEGKSPDSTIQVMLRGICFLNSSPHFYFTPIHVYFWNLTKNSWQNDIRFWIQSSVYVKTNVFYEFLDFIHEYFFIDLEIWVQSARRKCAWYEVKGWDGGAVRPTVIRSGQQQGADITSHGATAPRNRGSEDRAYRGQRSRLIQMEWDWYNRHRGTNFVSKLIIHSITQCKQYRK